ncbi:MAG TPA: CpsB/CapC family capsule biosynthesis tyrosine phosphatase [Ferruginibacter sp.]|nr:CpsB/CapC family capsule biosynthesis tyrosine phosphatase [Ferruginibacter sp.]
MFNFFKKKRSADNLPGNFPVALDIHSHILPGIDDGSPDIATSLQLIKGLYDLGIRRSIATPHIIGDMYRNTPEIINEALEKTRAACKEAGIAVELSAAAEYMLDDYFMELLNNRSPLLTLHKNILLTEISYSTPTDNLEEIVAGIIEEGYRPVLAHPERYFFYHRNFEKYYRLKEMGFRLQVNLLSLTGFYGSGVKKAAKFILEKDLADLVGTDMHHRHHLAALGDPKNRAIFQQYLGTKVYNDLDKLE